jgi:ketosteroid isomerase-like protein
VSRERLELVRRGYDAWNSGDRSWVLDHMSPDVEWVSPPEDPDPGTYRGYEGVEKFWGQWRAAVGQLHFEIEEMFDHGDQILVVARRKGRGEHSGLEVSDQVIQVFTFEGEKCVRVNEYYDRAAALRDVEAAGTAGSGAAAKEGT